MRIALLALAASFALAACADPEGGGIDLVDVSGPLDASALDFISDSIEHGAAIGQELSVIQLNSKAVLDEDAFERLAGLVSSPPLPVAVWVGPAPAFAYGAAADLPTLASQAAVAPGSFLGHTQPAVLGASRSSSDEVVEAADSGFDLQPTFRQYLQDLDGATFQTVSGPVVVSTIEEITGGVTTREVTFRKPGLTTRFFRLAVTPEAAFFFLIIGLTIAAFEFYALGPGVAAGVSAISLLLASWGMVTLPVRPAALLVIVAGFALLLAAHQRGGYPLVMMGGALALQVGGQFFVDGGGQIEPRWWLILPSVLGALFFFLLAMPTVQRARLSTETIGREGLVGEAGVASTDFDPEGLVEVRGATWRGTAHREAGIRTGDEVVVSGVDGLYLEVAPTEPVRET